MPGYIIHIAIATQYLKKHKEKYDEDFILGSISPDLTDNKSLTHFGKSPAYTNLKGFLLENTLNTNLSRGHFLHLISDYLFYNSYLEKLSKPQIYDDYDCTNKNLIQKYKLIVPNIIKDKIFFKEGQPQIINFPLLYKLIDEISNLNLEDVVSEVLNNKVKWKKYKNLI